MANTDRLPEVAVYVVHLEDPPGSGRAACCGLLLPRLPEGGIKWGCTGCRRAATPAPLDVLVAARDVDLSWFVADLGDGTVKMRYASDLPRVLNALREALAPLDELK